ncbi:50S ribosomal protein L18 [Candidatus Saccharibacteria bacterium]|nr:50S ribosomal protein L18 [Candidatus Saccharibacteria bacterium]
MDRLIHKTQSSKRRAHRVRARLSGTKQRPRLTVHISNMHVTAQIIDDSTGQTLSYASSVGKGADGNMTTKASLVGEDIAKKAKQAKVSEVVFDRGPKKYHGRIKSLADTARAGGLKF